MRFFKVENENGNVVPFFSVNVIDANLVVGFADYSIANGHIPIYTLENIIQVFEESGFLNFKNSREYEALNYYSALIFGEFRFEEVPEKVHKNQLKVETPLNLNEKCIHVWINAFNRVKNKEFSLLDRLSNYQNEKIKKYLTDDVKENFRQAQASQKWKFNFSEWNSSGESLTDLYGEKFAVSCNGKMDNMKIGICPIYEEHDLTLYLCSEKLGNFIDFSAFDQVFKRKVVYE